MVTFWLLIDTTAMIGSPAARGAVASVVCSGRAWRGAASAGGAAVNAVRAAADTSVTMAGGADRLIVLVDGAIVNRFVMPLFPLSGIESNTGSGRMVPVLRPAVNKHVEVTDPYLGEAAPAGHQSKTHRQPA